MVTLMSFELYLQEHVSERNVNVGGLCRIMTSEYTRIQTGRRRWRKNRKRKIHMGVAVGRASRGSLKAVGRRWVT